MSWSRRLSVAPTLAAFVASTTMFAACGGGDTTPPTAAPPPTPPAGTPTTPPNNTVVTLNISGGPISLSSLGATAPLAVEARSASGSVVTAQVNWSSSNPNVVAVSATGLVTAVGNGSADVIAQSGSVSASVRATVQQVAASLTISPASVSLGSAGATQPLAVAVKDAGGRDMSVTGIEWSTANASIATVSQAGIVTGAGPGSTNVTARSGTLTATAQVTVGGSVSNCGSPVQFQHTLFDPSLLKVVTQIGVVGGANTEIVGRVYLFPNDGLAGQRLPLTAPGALNVIGAKHYIPQGAPAGYTPDWSLMLDAGCGIQIELYHVKDVSASIKAATDTTISSSSAWTPMPTPVSLAAGETFGWYIPGLNSVSFDLVAHDRTVVNRFANQARYQQLNSNLLNIVCPWNLFAPSRRDAYLAAIGSQSGQRIAGAGCGTVERDVVGTSAGQWFLSSGIPSSWTQSKVGMYGDPLPIMLGADSTVYIGHMGPTDDIRIARDNPTWKNPATITTSWCYQTAANASAPGWLWLRVVSASQMDVAYGSAGACPAQFPTSGFMAYYR